MYVMTAEQWQRFVLAGSRTAKLATVRRDGRPHCVPVWIIFDGDTIVFSSGRETVKTRNIEHNPHVVLTVDEEQFPYAFVSIEGQASIETPPLPTLRDYTTRIAERYVPAGQAAAFGERNAAATEVLIRVVIDKVIAWGGMSGEA